MENHSSNFNSSCFSIRYNTCVIRIGAGQGAQGQQGQDGDYMAIGNTKNPKNVIFMVGDGMGPSYNSAYRYYADNPNTKELDQTAFDKYLKGLTVLTLMILKKM